MEVVVCASFFIGMDRMVRCGESDLEIQLQADHGTDPETAGSQRTAHVKDPIDCSASGCDFRLQCCQVAHACQQ